MRTDTRTHDRVIAAAMTLGPVYDQLAKISRDDPAVFSQFVLRDESKNTRITLAPMHEEWHDILNKHPRAVIWTHTEGGKSAQISVGRVLFEIGKNPNIRILVLSAALGAAKKIVRALKNYIENSVEYRMVFPHIVPDKSDTTGMWRDDSFIVRRSAMSRDPTVQATGFNGNILGGRYDLIIIDDYLTAENTYSDHQRDRHYSWLKSTIEGRKTGESRLWFVGNAWHLDDSMHRYAAEANTFSKKYPILVDGVSSWPEVWPLTRIEAEIQNRGPIEAQRSMFCNAVSDADRRFKWKYIEIALELGNGLQMARALAFVPVGYRTVTGVDLAVTKRDSGDETAIVTAAVREKDSVRQVLDIQSGHWDGPQIIERLKDVHNRYHSHMWVESNAQQIMLKQFLNDQTAIPVKPFFTGKNKHDPAFGIESLAIEFSAGKWVLPNMGGALAGMQARMSPGVKKLIDQMLRYDPASHTGDVLMATWICREGARRAMAPAGVTKRPRRT
jgi:hypothetical protein